MGILYLSELQHELAQLQKEIDRYREAGQWTEAGYLLQDLLNLKQTIYRLESELEDQIAYWEGQM
jgi:flagellar motility protein MotE (MotC chaperone)